MDTGGATLTYEFTGFALLESFCEYVSDNLKIICYTTFVGITWDPNCIPIFIQSNPESDKFKNFHVYPLQVYFDLILKHAWNRIYRVPVGQEFNPFKPDFTLSSSSTTSRELLSQFSTCSGWKWFEEGGQSKKITMY